MILSRLGNKQRLSKELQALFPNHKMRIELFFGSGGSYFYLPKPKYAILNDFDDDVTNLYTVLLNQKEELKYQIQLMPISSSMVKYWKQHLETDPIVKALRFLLLSNFTYLGKGDTLRVGAGNTKRILLDNIEPTFLMLQNAQITNYDFREVLSKISFDSGVIARKDSFVYLDPVYLGTTHFYKVPKWTISDTEDCFKIMKASGIKCGMSEFSNKKVIELANDYKMNIQTIGERRNIKDRQTEIYISNYTTNQLKLF